MYIDDLQKEVFESSFQGPGEKIPADMWLRVATYLSSNENDQEFWAKEFFSNLENYQTTLGGRILSNAGNNLKGTSMINCFVLGPELNDNGVDSISEIYKNLTEQALTLKSEGGWGYNFSHLRPRGAVIKGIGVQSPGTIKFMELFDKSSEIITSGGGEFSFNKGTNLKKKVRKGAMMGILGCWHPSILEFITAKQVSNRLTKFNMSVAITNKFMEAVENDSDWELIFPDTGDEAYDKIWDGNIDKWINGGHKIEVYGTIQARHLWGKIMESSYNRNEPGVFFIDNANELNNLKYCEDITATNPCGEISMAPYNSCLLGSLNLVHFLNEDRTDWDYDKLAIFIPRQVRMMDNVVDLTYFPLPKQKDMMQQTRRLGMGILGYASALYMIGVKYGSARALQITEELMSFIANSAYRASSDLAKEKGCFPLYDAEKYWESKFINNSLTKETIEYCKRYGIRNSHLLAIAPTGNTSVYAGVVSGGIEPVFSREYIRTSIVHEIPDGLETPKYWEGDLHEVGLFKWVKEGDDDLLKTTEPFNDTYYKIDKSRGLTKESLVKDYGWRFCKDKEAAVTTVDLTVKDHIDTMAIFAKYVDQAISKTVNVSHSYPYEDFKHLYMDAWKKGIKGLTTYREGTMASVLSVKEEKDNGYEEVIIQENVRLPDNWTAKGTKLRAEGKKWYLHAAWLPNSDRPFALFVSTNHPEPNIITNDALEVLTTLALEKGIPEKWVNDLKEKSIGQRNAIKIARSISLVLRHGVAIKNIVAALDKINSTPGTFVFAIKRYLSSFIKTGTEADGICPHCGGTKLIFVQGCKECTECRISLCG